MDYEKYDIIVLNSKYKTISLDNVNKSGKTYLLDKNKNEYIWFNYEYLEEDIEVKKNKKLEVEIKFDKPYKPTLEAQKMVFSNIIVDNNEKLKMELEL